MIKKNTVFILGAGASAPFGFPIGKELLNQITKLIPEPPKEPIPANSNIIRMPPEQIQIFLDCGHTEQELQAFKRDLIQSQKNSVDAFLEHRPEYMMLGKLFIAKVLLGYEKLDAIYKNPDWYNYLWNLLNSTFDEFQENKVAFVTFNYDRSLETYLINCMKALYNLSENNCYFKLIKSIPIIHVHGKLGLFNFENIHDCTGFGEIITKPEKLKITSNHIKIVHEDISNDNEFIEAQKLIENAEQVIILGFGYDDKNLERIKINNAKGIVIGSSYGFSQNECRAIIKKNSNIKVCFNTGYQNLSYIRNEVVWD